MLLLFFLDYWLLPINSSSDFANFNPITGLAIPIGMPIKEAKAEIEIHLVTTEPKISVEYNL